MGLYPVITPFLQQLILTSWDIQVAPVVMVRTEEIVKVREHLQFTLPETAHGKMKVVSKPPYPQ